MSTKTNGGKSPNPEVSERATRRRFSAEYKLGILEEADRCALGEQGALLRREGLYSSHLVKWARAAIEGRPGGALEEAGAQGRADARAGRDGASPPRERTLDSATRPGGEDRRGSKKLSAMEQSLHEETN